MPSRHDRIAILASKHGIDHLSKTPDYYGQGNYHRITSSSLGKIGTRGSLVIDKSTGLSVNPEGDLLPAPIPRPDGGYY
ncbi:MAG: hypothetical protein MUF85_01780 [Patescibacteria group bacterium]|jgi:hypothetical protein|nr:hypothetical protein [Patescibacteria group bacterium]